MSSTSQPTTFADLYGDLMNRTREETGNAATIIQAKRYINIALQDMHVGQGEKFPWAERSAVLVTQPKYTTGTVTITKGSTDLAGTDTLWDTANDFSVENMRVGGRITINGGSEVYKIDSVTDDTNAVLTSQFVSDDVSDGSYVYFEDEYVTAPDFLRPIDQQKFDSPSTIDLVGRTEFRRRYPANRTPGEPKIATLLYDFVNPDLTGDIASIQIVSGTDYIQVVSANALSVGDTVFLKDTTYYDGAWQVIDGTTISFVIDTPFLGNGAGTWSHTSVSHRRVRFHPPPGTARMINYQYVTSNLARTMEGIEQQNLVLDTDSPIVPLQYRHAIVYQALATWYRDKQDDTRSADAANEYTKIMLRVISDNEIGGARPQIRPRVGTYRRRAKRPWGGGSGRYDTGGRFDRME